MTEMSREEEREIAASWDDDGSPTWSWVKSWRKLDAENERLRQERDRLDTERMELQMDRNRALLALKGLLGFGGVAFGGVILEAQAAKVLTDLWPEWRTEETL